MSNVQTPTKIILSLVLDQFTPLQKAITTAVAYGIGDIDSLRALFYPFSKTALAYGIQQLVMDNILTLNAPEKKVELSAAMLAVYQAITEINQSSGEFLKSLVNDNKTSGSYKINNKFLEAMLAEHRGNLNIKKIYLMLEVIV